VKAIKNTIIFFFEYGKILFNRNSALEQEEPSHYGVQGGDTMERKIKGWDCTGA
jgi:hypothetical protein